MITNAIARAQADHIDQPANLPAGQSSRYFSGSPLMFKFVRVTTAAILCVLSLGVSQIHTSAQRQPRTTTNKPATADTISDDANQSEMRPIIESYVADRGSLQRS